jgi:hypothetical protein
MIVNKILFLEIRGNPQIPPFLGENSSKFSPENLNSDFPKKLKIPPFFFWRK